MIEEEALQAAIDSDVTDVISRRVLADLFDDYDDPRAAGYRILGEGIYRPRYVHSYYPAISEDARYINKYPRGCWEWWNLSRCNKHSSLFVQNAAIAEELLNLMPCNHPYYVVNNEDNKQIASCDYFTRREAEDAFAIGILCLYESFPPEKCKELLTKSNSLLISKG